MTEVRALGHYRPSPRWQNWRRESGSSDDQQRSERKKDSIEITERVHSWMLKITRVPSITALCSLPLLSVHVGRWLLVDGAQRRGRMTKERRSKDAPPLQPRIVISSGDSQKPFPTRLSATTQTPLSRGRGQGTHPGSRDASFP